MKPCANTFLSFHNSDRVKLIIRLRLRFSHLHEKIFWHDFRDTLNQICSCGYNIETTTHQLFHCSDYLSQKLNNLLNNLQSIKETLDRTDSWISELLPFGDPLLNDAKNAIVSNLILNDWTLLLRILKSVRVSQYW